MKLAIFLSYLVVEVAAIVGLIYLIGPWWTIAIILATVVGGVVMLRRRGRDLMRQLREVQSAPAADADRRALAPLIDVVLLAASTILMLVPGIVTTVVGALLLLKPVRFVARPLVVAIGARKLAQAMERVPTFVTPGSYTVIDGEVVNQPTSGDYPRGYQPRLEP